MRISIRVFTPILLGLRCWRVRPSVPGHALPHRAALSSSPRSCTIPTNPSPVRRILQQEWIELFNRGPAAVSLAGWRFSDGVDFVFPNVTLGAGQYLVVAADVNVFMAKHPGVTNVVGGWTGWLRNSGEKLELVDSAGAVVNTVRYADQGDWGVRELGPASSGQRGWQWSDASDGDGKSLELINASLPNEFGQNWAASLAKGGTPGKANSVAAGDIAPMILEARPRADDPQVRRSGYGHGSHSG